MNEEVPTGEFIEFRIHDEQRFLMLVKVFEALKAAKEGSGPAPDPEAPYWQDLFDEPALAHFWWPTEEERQEHRLRWFATPVEQRWSAPSLETAWDFASMVEAFYSGEYNLIACRCVSSQLGRFEFCALAYPYGGTGCMKALLEAFGFEIVRQVGVV